MSNSSSTDSVSSLVESGKKRKYVDLSKEDYLDIFSSSTQDEKDRDKSIADYFDTTKRNENIRTLEATMSSQAFAYLSDEVRSQVQAKYEASVLHFIQNLNK